MARKKFLKVLSTAAIATLLLASVSSPAFAKATKIAVDGKDGKVYEYKYDELESSLLSQLTKGSNDPSSKLYNDFYKRLTSVRGLYDDVKKSYIEYNLISKEYTDALLNGKQFNLTSFLESPTTPTTTITANTISIGTDGNLLVNGQISESCDKPVVKSVTIIDSETIRVKFNKDVDFNYAHNIANYKLLDKDSLDISNHIKGIYSTVSESDKQNTDTYFIKLHKCNPNNTNEDWKLTNSKYILTIKNIIDTCEKPNTMDDSTYSLNANNDTTAPKLTGIYSSKNSTNKDKIIVYFNKAMDADSLVNKDNYKIINGEGDYKSLPCDSTLSVAGDNNGVIIELPSIYNVIPNSSSNTGKTKDITQLIVSNVKDSAGNILEGAAYRSKISSSRTIKTTVKPNTIKAYSDGDDLKISLIFTNALDEVNRNDFTLGGVTPDGVAISGSKVTLIFKDGSLATAAETAAHPVTYANGKTNNTPTKIDIIKAQGLNAKLAINATTTTDETGDKVSINENGSPATLSKEQATIYNYEVAPKTTSNYWSATKDSNSASVYVTFDTPLDINSGIKTDDFAFIATNGTDVKADSVQINGNTVIFKFNNTNINYEKITNSLSVNTKNSCSLRSVKDRDNNYCLYIPSSDDLKHRLININK